ncbi:MAG TPA: glycosyltransferase [Candidatus Binataceae bacterium]|nr:glycosyltransferase [Candidatus Binataceae bacterium]
MSSDTTLEFTLVVETFNYLEGTSLNSVRAALQAALECKQDDQCEVVLVDVTGDPKVARLTEEQFPSVHFLKATGLGYDEAKALAAREALGRFVVYLDCDCLPEPGWFERLTAPLQSGEAAAVAGFPWYGDGYLTKLKWLMDFGFMLPRANRELGCYPSNNSAFVRDLILRIPEPDGPMRCRCYAHSQELARQSFPVRLVADAAVRHEPPPFFRERIRQGYDMIAACWVDPQLPEAQWLRLGVRSAIKYYRRRVALDCQALRYREEIELGAVGAAVAYPLLALARLLDAIGIVGALAFGPPVRRWLDPTSQVHA